MQPIDLGYFGNLPVEVWNGIFKYLHPFDLALCLRVNRFFLSNFSKTFWHIVFQSLPKDYKRVKKAWVREHVVFIKDSDAFRKKANIFLRCGSPGESKLLKVYDIDYLVCMATVDVNNLMHRQILVMIWPGSGCFPLGYSSITINKYNDIFFTVTSGHRQRLCPIQESPVGIILNVQKEIHLNSMNAVSKVGFCTLL